MKIKNNNIEKLRVIRVNTNNVFVENLENQRGIIFINEVANSFIVSLPSVLKTGDIVYGYLFKKEGNKRFYSLKVGHTSSSRFVNETGGGYLGIKYLLNNYEKKNNEFERK